MRRGLIHSLKARPPRTKLAAEKAPPPRTKPAACIVERFKSRKVVALLFAGALVAAPARAQHPVATVTACVAGVGVVSHGAPMQLQYLPTAKAPKVVYWFTTNRSVVSVSDAGSIQGNATGGATVLAIARDSVGQWLPTAFLPVLVRSDWTVHEARPFGVDGSKSQLASACRGPRIAP